MLHDATRCLGNEEKAPRDNAQYGAQRRGPPREGPALLQGLAICGVCGRNMGVRYHTRDEKYPDHVRGSKVRADTGCGHRTGRSALRWTPLTLVLG